jgi:tetratricopeptide (TPR) repeat protein
MSEPVRGNRGLRRCLPCLRRAAWVFGFMLCAAGAPALAATGKCKLGQMAQFQVTMSQMSPEIVAKINGTEERLIIDSGSFFSMIDAASASALGLHVRPAPVGFYGRGIGGQYELSIATANEFTLPGLTLRNLDFVVGGSHVGEQAVGVLGRDLLQIGDAEYDFADGVARLMKAENCGDALLAYWLRPGDAYSMIKIVKPEQSLELGSRLATRKDFKAPVIAIAYVNGAAIRAMFDTGASSSFLSVKAAAKAGLKVDSPGVVPAGDVRGFGQSTVKTYIAPVEVFKIGDEEVRNTRLRLGDTDLPDADMLIGADFFLSHHIYVANSQDKLYFSYNGGPVFNLVAQRTAGSVPNAAAPAAEAPTAASPADAKQPGEDASEYARRGAALRARQELDQALQSFNRACELAPDNADYFYQRGLLYQQLNQSGPALADFDRTIQLEPHHVAALVARARYRVRSGDKTGAEADLDAASAVLPKEDSERLTLAAGYSSLDLSARAIEQYSLWIAAHGNDVLLPNAQNGRCWQRALAGTDLSLALKDCDAALKRARKGSDVYAHVSDSRGLVFLRLGDYPKSIADYDASIAIDPKSAWSWYGRGIDKLRQHQTAAGDADIAQAENLAPKIAEAFAQHGIEP